MLIRYISVKHHTINTTIFLLIFSLFSFTCGISGPGKNQPVAVKGILDISEWNFGKDGPVNLDGEWEFYWNRLLAPQNFLNTKNPPSRGFINLPGFWKNHIINRVKLNGEGYATYRLKIRNGLREKLTAINISNIYSTYKLWINGEFIHQKGLVDPSERSREQFVFLFDKQTLPITLNKGMNEIVLQVLNYHYDSGGTDRSIELGDRKPALKKQNIFYSMNMIVVGILLFMAIYNIFLFFHRKEDASPLYFGLFSLVLAINTLTIHTPIIQDCFSNQRIPYLIDSITAILNAPFVFMIIKSLFPEDCSNLAVRLIQILTGIFIFILFFTGFKTSETIIKIYYLSCVLFMIYSVYIFIRIIYNRKNDALLFFIGFIAVFLGSIHDMLNGARIIDSENIFHYGMLVLCFSMTMVISRRFSRAFHEVAKLSKNLEKNNIALARMDKIKDEFLANTSHELRNPLHGIIGMSESMIEGGKDTLPTGIIENLSLIASSGHRLKNLVNDLLDMAKIEDNSLNLIIKPVNISVLIDLVVKLSIPLIGDKPVAIINNVGPDIPAVMGDEDRIKQMMHNLIANAVKFTNKGTVEISASVIDSTSESHDPLSEQMVEVRVSDTGIGVPEEYKEKIFESFQQVDGTESRSYPGTGLGLAITKKLVELHNGKIYMLSQKNNGSIFAFTLPVSNISLSCEPKEIAIEDNSESSSGIPHETDSQFRLPQGEPEIVFENNPVILIVDDDPTNIRILQNYFESKNCTLITATDGFSALEIINENNSIDLVLLDIMMPGISGYDVCKRIRINRSTEDLPIIMLTAKNLISDINAAFEAGANDYIVKPFLISELMARVNTMLKLKNIQRSAAEGISLGDRTNNYYFKYNDILYITSHAKNTVIHTLERDIEIHAMMKEIIEKFPGDIFIRIHKQYVINIYHVLKLTHVHSGRYRLTLNDDDDTELPVGSMFRDEIRKILKLNSAAGGIKSIAGK